MLKFRCFLPASIEIEEVEVVDQCDSFYEDRTDHLGYGKAGRFENLDEAVAFGQGFQVSCIMVPAEVLKIAGQKGYS